MTTPIEHFSKITKDVLQELHNLGILKLYLDEACTTEMSVDCPQAQSMIENITKSIYEGTVKEMNPHRAPDLS